MFDQFWQQYPRKVAKRAASKVWDRLSIYEQQLALDAIPNHVIFWETKMTALDFIPHASTWLNQGRYEDELVIEPIKNKVMSGLTRGLIGGNHHVKLLGS